MIHINVSEGLISGSYGETPFSVTYDQNLYDAMIKVANAANDATDMETYKLHLDEFESLTVEDYTKVIQDKCEFIYVNPSSGDFFLKVGDVVTNQPMPKALVDRIYESIDMGIDFEPLVKMWTRWLRNPLLKEKGQDFSERFFNFVNMKYVHPKLMKELVEEQGLTEEVAERRATMYQMKITKEGLLNGYKVSKEVLHKYDAESGERVDRYKRTFNPDTGEIDSEGIPEVVEDRLFEPAIMGSGGDAFSCEGSNGFNSDGHFIKVGCSHRLPSWDCVNTNDYKSCVKGLHVGGLKYISFYSGEIHNVFIDPMHVGAIPDDVDGAIRCLQYFVHSSLAGVNGSIYHSSTYAAKTDEEWKNMRKEILVDYLDQVNQVQESRKQLMEL
ncbi:MAG: hypothetical protein CL867_12065 [Cytophagaceae bacterium]|nr:hypothetical protein [Cytophagaceae bacterium]